MRRRVRKNHTRIPSMNSSVGGVPNQSHEQADGSLNAAIEEVQRAIAGEGASVFEA
jgi:hypothetical protein